MKPEQLSIAVEAMINAGQPTFIWGAPGVGKSQVIKQTCERMGRQLIDLRAVLLDPVD
jgi:MoxR-like ATPase